MNVSVRGPGWLGLGWAGSGVVGGAGLAVLLGVVVDPSAAPRLPAAAAAPACVAGIAGAGLALLMRRSAARLASWPTP